MFQKWFPHVKLAEGEDGAKLLEPEKPEEEEDSSAGESDEEKFELPAKYMGEPEEEPTHLPGPEHACGCLVARPYEITNRRGYDRWFVYFGIITSIEPTDEFTEDDEPGLFKCNVTMEDGEDTEELWAEMIKGESRHGRPVICPCDRSGVPYLATRKAEVKKVPFGLLVENFEDAGKEMSLVARGRYTLPEETTTDERFFATSARAGWTFETLPSSVWPIDEEECTMEQFKRIWSWMHQPTAQRERSERPEAKLLARLAAGQAEHQKARIAKEDAGTPFDVSNMPEERQAAYHTLLQHLPAAERFGHAAYEQDRSLYALHQNLRYKHRGLEERRKPYKPRRRWPKDMIANEEEDKLYVELARALMEDKRGTENRIRSQAEGYRQWCCDVRKPPVAPWPLTADKVTTWFVGMWKAKMSCRNLDQYLLSVRKIAVDFGMEKDSKFPGMDEWEYRKAKKVADLLKDFDERGVRRSFPLVMTFLSFILDYGEVDLSDLQHLQWWARTLLCHACMARAEDHCRGRPRIGDYISTGAAGDGRACWIVRPGKCHNTSAEAEIFGTKSGEDAPPLGLQAGAVMRLYLDALEKFHGGPLHPADPLFPDLRKLGKSRPGCNKASVDKKFMSWLRNRARISGMPQAMIDKIQYHGFRSGGCTDLFLGGAHDTNIIEFIKKQGRWKSEAFTVYIRLRPDVIAKVLSETLARARTELPTMSPQQVQRMRQLYRELGQQTWVGNQRNRTVPAPSMFTR